MAAQRFTTTMPTSPTAERSSIATTSTTAILTMAISTTATGSTEVDTRLFTLSQVDAPARSVVLITAAMSMAFHPAGGRAFEEARPGVVSMAAVGDGIADRMYPQVE